MRIHIGWDKMFVLTTNIKQVMQYIIMGLFGLFVIVFLWTYSYVTYSVQGDTAKIEVFYFIPMKQMDISNHIRFISEIPDAEIQYQQNWKTPFKLEVVLTEKSRIKGQEVIIELNRLPSSIFFIRKSKSINLRFQTVPELIEISPVENVNTKGNILIRFNSFIDPDSIKNNVKFSIPGMLYPKKIKQENKERVDYSQWIFSADQKLSYNTTYELVIKKGLKNFSGVMLGNDITKKFKTTQEPKVIETYPKNGQKDVALYTQIRLVSNQPILSGEIEIKNVKGKIECEEYEIIFTPEDILLPNTKYSVKGKILSTYHEPSKEVQFEFLTSTIKENTVWLEVVIGEDKHKLILHEGQKSLKEFRVGLDPKIFPEGVYQIQEASFSFYGPYFTKYPSTWIRFGKNKYIQNLPENLGDSLYTLKSSNCIYIDEENMRWLKGRLKGGEMVIIHSL